uniref:SCAN box domain-containing protein n=1 Tax=Latimeria chalumnae TaxID=7897 RepID=H3AFR2_LATCH
MEDVLKWLGEEHRRLQAEQQAFLEQMLQQLATQAPASGEGGPEGGQPIKLTKMGPKDDPDAFLLTFERVAVANGWPKEQWALRLAPFLTGEAQAAYRALPNDRAYAYDHVKVAIKDRLGISSETYRQKLRGERLGTGERPQVLAHRIQDLCQRWLTPETRSSHKIVDSVALEQFLWALIAIARWVGRHRPSTLATGIQLAEEYVDGESLQTQCIPGWSRYETKSWGAGDLKARDGPRKMMETHMETVCDACGKRGNKGDGCQFMELREPCTPEVNPYLTTVLLEWKRVRALIDSGSRVTLVHKGLINPERWRTLEPMHLCCVHGDTRIYPTAKVVLEVHGKVARKTVGVVDSLPYPMVLGRD